MNTFFVSKTIPFFDFLISFVLIFVLPVQINSFFNVKIAMWSLYSICDSIFEIPGIAKLAP